MLDDKVCKRCGHAAVKLFSSYAPCNHCAMLRQLNMTESEYQVFKKELASGSTVSHNHNGKQNRKKCCG